jgi:threonine/homoserine/homoserine lactone efflux protein
MNEFNELLLAWFTGVVSGFLVCLPVGPTNIAIINEGARRGFLRGVMIGLGSVTMEVIWCAIAFAGFSGFFDSRLMRAVMELTSFLLVLFLGFKYLLAHGVPVTPRTVEKIEEKLHPHTAFASGFVRVLGNPSVLLFWITLSATFIAHGWMEDSWASKGVCIGGVAMGAGVWFLLLSWAVSIGHRKFSTRTLERMSQVSGACLLVLAVVIGVRLVKLLAHRGG